MGPHVEAAWGSWDADAQAERFAKAPLSEHHIVVFEGRPIGCLLVLRESDAVILSRIWIMPSSQQRGIGTRLVWEVCEQATREGLPVRLRVLKVNRARRLYERLGFETVSATPTHFVMERRSLKVTGSGSA